MHSKPCKVDFTKEMSQLCIAKVNKVNIIPDFEALWSVIIVASTFFFISWGARISFERLYSQQVRRWHVMLGSFHQEGMQQQQ